jgi:hypothetical protein
VRTVVLASLGMVPLSRDAVTLPGAPPSPEYLDVQLDGRVVGHVQARITGRACVRPSPFSRNTPCFSNVLGHRDLKSQEGSCTTDNPDRVRTTGAGVAGHGPGVTRRSDAARPGVLGRPAGRAPGGARATWNHQRRSFPLCREHPVFEVLGHTNLHFLQYARGGLEL